VQHFIATYGYAAVGYAVGTNWQSIVNGFHWPTYIIAAIVVVGIVIAVWRYVRRRKAELREEDSTTGGPDATTGGPDAGTLYREGQRDGTDPADRAGRHRK
jgi:hypothetical protein